MVIGVALTNAAFAQRPALTPFGGLLQRLTIALGDPDDAVASLLGPVVGHVGAAELERYRPATSGNAASLRSLGHP